MNRLEKREQKNTWNLSILRSSRKVDFLDQTHWSNIGEFTNELEKQAYESQRRNLKIIKSSGSNRPIFDEGLSTDLRKSDWDYIEEHLKPDDWNDDNKIRKIEDILGKPEIVTLYVRVRRAFHPDDFSLEFLYPNQRRLLAKDGAARILWAVTGKDIFSAVNDELNKIAFSTLDKVMKSNVLLTPYRMRQYRLSAYRDREINGLKTIYRFEASDEARKFNGEPILIFGYEHQFEAYQNPYVNVRRLHPN